jgi:mRNA interferase RelE/StbE
MIYAVTIKTRAAKVLIGINEPYYTAIKKAIYSLATNPRPQGYKKLAGRKGYRIRVGNYRVVYEIFDTQLLIDLIDLGHRKDVYD